MKLADVAPKTDPKIVRKFEASSHLDFGRCQMQIPRLTAIACLGCTRSTI